MTMPAELAVDKNDNYSVVYYLEDGNRDTAVCVGLEHNITEAKALAAFLTNERGIGHFVVGNSRADVAEALKVTKVVRRHPLRQFAFQAMGIV